MGIQVVAAGGINETTTKLSIVTANVADEQRSANRTVVSMAELNAAKADILKTAGIESEIVEDDGVQLSRTRANDASPFYGGGMMYSYTVNGSFGKQLESACSSGFSVSIFGVPHATTARHCDADNWYSPGGGTYQSSGTQRQSPLGAARFLEAAGDGYVFDGRWDNSEGYSKPVEGLQDVMLGDQVCTDGANSGVHCWARVSEMSYWFKDKYGMFQNIIATKIGGGYASVAGDSGGPVLIPHSNGKVGAVGMIQGETDALLYTLLNLGCRDTRISAQHCGSKTFFTPMRQLWTQPQEPH